MLGGKFANFNSQSKLNDFVDIPHSTTMPFSDTCMISAARVFYLVNMSNAFVTGRSLVEIPRLHGKFWEGYANE